MTDPTPADYEAALEIAAGNCGCQVFLASVIVEIIAQARADERGACAEVCDGVEEHARDYDEIGEAAGALRCAAAIRRRGEG